jgi:hypothetical protein
MISASIGRRAKDGALHSKLQSLVALGSIAIEEQRRPGRKLLFWLGPGWRFENVVGVGEFDFLTELLTRPNLLPRLPLNRSGVMVEYGPVVLGENTYICPVRSVSISRQRRIMDIDQWGAIFKVDTPFETLLDDMAFEKYHMFVRRRGCYRATRPHGKTNSGDRSVATGFHRVFNSPGVRRSGVNTNTVSLLR